VVPGAFRAAEEFELRLISLFSIGMLRFLENGRFFPRWQLNVLNRIIWGARVLLAADWVRAHATREDGRASDVRLRA